MTEKKSPENEKCSGNCNGCCPFVKELKLGEAGDFDTSKCSGCKEDKSIKGGDKGKKLELILNLNKKQK